jgi:UDP-N-acetylmuramoyl-L-alanyl-D-glutamate--2,6-diaminopimelate ligase
MKLPRIPAAPDWARDVLSVGVTGTNGKSTTTTWLARLLRELGGSVFSATTLGYALDDQRQNFAATFDGFTAAVTAAHQAGAKHFALEMTSEALAAGYARAWPCKIGVFTNLSHDHIDAHGSPEHYLASKAQLFLALPPGGTAVLNVSDPNGALLAEILPKDVTRLTYAEASRGEPWTTPSLAVEVLRVTTNGTLLRLSGGMAGLPQVCRLQVAGSIFAENAAAALLGAFAAGLPLEQGVAALERCRAPEGRLQRVLEQPSLFVDYAHTPDALARTLSTARALAAPDERRAFTSKVWVVFGAGGDRDRQKRAPMGEAARAADHVILTTDNPRSEKPEVIAAAIQAGLAGHASVRVILDRQEAIAYAVLHAADDDIIVLAGKGHERNGGKSDADWVREIAQLVQVP